MALHVGIDFGTSNSGVAVSDGSQVLLLPIDKKSVIPEVVKTVLYITKDFKHSIGQDAVELYYKHNVNRQRKFVKKRVGELEFQGAEMFYVRDVYTYVDELKPGRLLQLIKTALRSEDYRGTMIFDRYYDLVDIIAIYLGELKSRAEAILHEEISSVTLGRPVKFFDHPAQDRNAEEALRQAAEKAGFNQVAFELEPIAAALNYEMTITQPQNVLVFDFGGGTLDITILRLGDPRDRTVYASGGVGIAGSDFDRAIIEKRMLSHFGMGKIHGKLEIDQLIRAISDWVALPDLSTPQAKYQLEQAIQSGIAPARLKALETLIFNDLSFSFYNAVEACKIKLSDQGSAVIALQAEDLDIWELYTRYQFEKDIQDYQRRIEKVLLDTVLASGLELGQIDAVVKTGGSSHIPFFTDMLCKSFDQERIKVSNVFSSVAAGLAIRAYQNAGK